MDGGGRTASGTAVERPLQRILRSRHSHIPVQHNAGAVAEHAGLWRDGRIRIDGGAVKHVVEDRFELVAESELAKCAQFIGQAGR